MGVPFDSLKEVSVICKLRHISVPFLLQVIDEDLK